MSLVDNPQETFGLAVAEAMAAGLPLVVSDWNGYRDLVRDGMDGFRVATRWASVAQQASVPLGWQQLLGLEPYPKVAGALGQLVHVDTQAAEAACLTLLTRSELRAGHGAAARQRACETFHPDVVMSQIEALFLDLQCRRQQAVTSPASPSPQLDLVRMFAGYATNGKLTRWFNKILRNMSLSSFQFVQVPGPVVGSFEGLSARGTTQRALGRTCAQAQPLFRDEPEPLIRTSLPFQAKLRHWLITSRWQRWLFPVCCAVPYVGILLVIESRVDLGRPGAFGSHCDGRGVGGMTLWLARQEFRNSLRR